MVVKMSEAGSLEEEALKRKERLKALKRKKDDTSDGKLHADIEQLPKPKFRSYNPQSEKLKENALPMAQPASIEEEIKMQLDAAKSKVVIDELDITNLAPRKPDWDLKRDVAKKLEKLERRTQKAIAELIRDRLKQQKDDGLGNDLASAVNVGTMN